MRVSPVFASRRGGSALGASHLHARHDRASESGGERWVALRVIDRGSVTVGVARLQAVTRWDLAMRSAPNVDPRVTPPRMNSPQPPRLPDRIPATKETKRLAGQLKALTGKVKVGVVGGGVLSLGAAGGIADPLTSTPSPQVPKFASARVSSPARPTSAETTTKATTTKLTTTAPTSHSVSVPVTTPRPKPRPLP